MLYITTAPFSLLSYYVFETYEAEKEKLQFYENVDLLQFRSILIQGDLLQPKVCVVSLKNNKVPLELVQSTQNTTYLSVPVQNSFKEWKSLTKEKEWVKGLKLTPERYKKIINQTQIFTEDSEEWFWRKFKYHPKKMRMEILNLEARFNTKIPVHFLQAFYSSNSVDLYIRLNNYLATPTGTQVIRELPTSDLWTFFIGTSNKPPFIQTSFLSKRDKGDSLLEVPLILFQNSIENKNITIKNGAVVFNQWLIEIGTRKINGNLKLEYSIEDLKRLENYLGI